MCYQHSNRGKTASIGSASVLALSSRGEILKLDRLLWSHTRLLLHGGHVAPPSARAAFILALSLSTTSPRKLRNVRNTRYIHLLPLPVPRRPSRPPRPPATRIKACRINYREAIDCAAGSALKSSHRPQVKGSAWQALRRWREWRSSGCVV
jgi:hypothetical protein